MAAVDRPSVFVSHDREQLPLASALVDLLEESISTCEGAVACRGVPGYEAPLDAVLAGVRTAGPAQPRPLLLALPSMRDDSAVEGDIRAADEAGVSVLLLGATDASEPRRARSATRLPLNRDGLVALVEDVAYALRARPRFSQAARAAMDSVIDAYAGMQPRPQSKPQSRPQSRPQSKPEPQPRPLASVPARSGPPPLPGRARVAPPPPPRPVETPSQSMTVPKQRRVSAVQSVDAGIDLSDCLHASLDASGLRLKLQTNFAPFLTGLGGDFEQLSRFTTDAGDWFAAVDDRLEGLSEDLAWLGDWHVAGFQLATLCYLAALPGGSRPPDLNQQTAQAWEAFCAACQGVGVPTESLTDFRAMLQSMAGSDGDTSARNWCLDHLRGHAEQEDEARVSGMRAVAR